MQVRLEQFEGPLGLLLFLIRKEEMDIYDIQIQRITHQYMEYLKQLQNIDLEQAGDFVAMAATLIQIKAKMLLPSYDENGEIVEEEDPRKPLVQRLLEYQKYQETGKLLNERPLLGREIWLRGMPEDFKENDDSVLIEEDNALYALISMYRTAIKKAEKATHRVSAKLQSIASRIMEMSKLLIPGQRIELREFLQGEEYNLKRLVITFLSSLELGKLGYANIEQTETYGPLYVHVKKPVTGDIISQVTEYETVTNEAPPPLPTAGTALSEVEQQIFHGEVDDDTELETVKVRFDSAQDETYAAEEAATDEEILAAELELANEIISEDDSDAAFFENIENAEDTENQPS